MSGVSQPQQGRSEPCPGPFARSILLLWTEVPKFPLSVQTSVVCLRGSKLREVAVAAWRLPWEAWGPPEAREGEAAGRRYCIGLDGLVGTADKGHAPSPSATAAVDLGTISLSCVPKTRRPLLCGRRLGKRSREKQNLVSLVLIRLRPGGHLPHRGRERPFPALSSPGPGGPAPANFSDELPGRLASVLVAGYLLLHPTFKKQVG